jgi:hypothetical protein
MLIGDVVLGTNGNSAIYEAVRSRIRTAGVRTGGSSRRMIIQTGDAGVSRAMSRVNT